MTWANRTLALFLLLVVVFESAAGVLNCLNCASKLLGDSGFFNSAGAPSVKPTSIDDHCCGYKNDYTNIATTVCSDYCFYGRFTYLKPGALKNETIYGTWRGCHADLSTYALIGDISSSTACPAGHVKLLTTGQQRFTVCSCNIDACAQEYCFQFPSTTPAVTTTATSTATTTVTISSHASFHFCIIILFLCQNIYF